MRGQLKFINLLTEIGKTKGYWKNFPKEPYLGIELTPDGIRAKTILRYLKKYPTSTDVRFKIIGYGHYKVSPGFGPSRVAMMLLSRNFNQKDSKNIVTYVWENNIAPKKICLIGPHGVGKTTYLEFFRGKKFDVLDRDWISDNSFVIYPEITRKLMQEGMISKNPGKADQKFLYRHKRKQFLEFCNSLNSAIIDRSPFDVLAYSLAKKFETPKSVRIKIRGDYRVFKDVEFRWIKPYIGWKLKADDERPGDILYFNTVNTAFKKIISIMKEEGYHVTEDTSDSIKER